MFRPIIKYLIIIIFTALLTFQFSAQFAKIRLIPVGIVKLIFPENKVKPTIGTKDKKESLEKILNANSFYVHYNEVDYFSGYNINSDGSPNFQHRSAGFFGSYKNNDLHLQLYTRDGFLITKNNIEQFQLPRFYDSHNSHGGIRGIFFINNETYAFMSSKKIGCQNMSLINLKRKIEIFETDCLPDYQKIHLNGIGGASIHKDNNILLSIGAPTNSSDKIRKLAQNDNSFYGKIVSINKDEIVNFLKNSDKKIKVETFTKGHRNPQGLANIKNSYFSSEHGPKGGDEINVLNKNNNYGWPLASYGTKYEILGEASYKLNHNKEKFTEPLLQFTPSIAISDLSNCTKMMIDYFERDGCLLATSLRKQSLYIILLSDDFDRIIGYEELNFGERLRHFAKKKDGTLFFGKDGAIYITTDAGKVFKINFKFKKSYIN